MTMGTTNLESMEVTLPPTLVVEHHAACSADPAAIAQAVGAAVAKVQGFLTNNAIAAAGPPRIIYSQWSPTGLDFTAAIPIAEVPPKVVDTADVSIKALPESTALRFVHRGPYREVKQTYDRIEAWLRERGGITTAADWARYSPMWEEYMNDPTTTPETELVTRIYLTLP